MEFLGLIAGTLTTISFVPQVLKIYQSKSAKDVSTPMFVIFSIGVVLWLIYGLGIGSLPVILSNIITLILSTLVLILKWKYR